MVSGARRRLIVVVVIVIAAVQVGVPMRTLFDPRSSRFGWQMYSSLSLLPVVQIEDAAGELSPIDVSPLIADPRAEIHWAEPLAELICHDDEVVAVVVTDHGRTDRVPCQ